MNALKIDDRKQLFFDDHIIQEADGCKRIVHKWIKEAADPVFTKKFPWEAAGPVAGTVYYDAVDSKYKMWYGSYDSKTGKYPKGYAVSEDGIKWKRNADMMSEGEYGSVLIDPRKKAGETRFFSELYLRPSGKLPGRVSLRESIDGINWHEIEGRSWWEGPSDVIDIMWDTQKEKYVSYHKIWRVKGTSVSGKEMISYFATFTPKNKGDGTIEITGRELFPEIREVKYDLICKNKGKDDGGGGIVTDDVSMLRVIGRAQSSDFRNWTDHSIVLEPDDDDPIDVQYYGMPVFEYEGLYLAFPRYFEGISGRMDVRFAYSRNGIDFVIPDKKLVLECGEKDTWDGGMVIAAPNPISIGNRICMYYGAYDKDHTCHGPEYKAATGRAWVREDGFMSITGGKLTTKAIVLSGNTLFINAVGKIKIQVLGINGDVYGSHEWQGDSTVEPVVQNLFDLKSRVIKFYFDLSEGELFSFCIR